MDWNTIWSASEVLLMRQVAGMARSQIAWNLPRTKHRTAKLCFEMMPLANKRLFLLPHMMSNCLAFCDLFSDGYQMGTLSYSHVYRRFPRTKHKVTPPRPVWDEHNFGLRSARKKGGERFWGLLCSCCLSCVRFAIGLFILLWGTVKYRQKVRMQCRTDVAA